MIGKDDDEADESFGQIGTSRYNSMPSLIALQQMRITEPLFTREFPDAFIELGRLNYHSQPKASDMIFNNLPDKAHFKVVTDLEFMSGTKLIKHNLIEVGPAPYPFLALSRGGEQLEVVRTVFQALLEKIVKYTELRYDFISMNATYADAVKKKNVLGKLIIPKTINTIMYILGEMEELEREDFYRLKKVQRLKVMKREDVEKREKKERELKEQEKLRLKGTSDRDELLDGALTNSEAEKLGLLDDDLESKLNRSKLSKKIENELDRNNLTGQEMKLDRNNLTGQERKLDRNNLTGQEMKLDRNVASKSFPNDNFKEAFYKTSESLRHDEKFGSGTLGKEYDSVPRKPLSTFILDDITSGGFFYRSFDYISSLLSSNGIRRGPISSNVTTRRSEPSMSNRRSSPVNLEAGGSMNYNTMVRSENIDKENPFPNIHLSETQLAEKEIKSKNQ